MPPKGTPFLGGSGRKNAPKRDTYSFLLASYCSMVRIWMVTAVSPFCQNSLLVVTVRVTLQEEKETAKADRIQTVRTDRVQIDFDS